MASLKPGQSMNGAWIEAFKVGNHTASDGTTINWTTEKIDQYLAKYNPAFHEAPIRVDHVEPAQRKGRGPGFGWIEEAKREGDTVFVKLRQVTKEFEEWVRQGYLKKRSIALDADKGIHHLAFLGHNCPAVPGMENVYDDGDKCIRIEFNEEDLEETGLVSAMKKLFAEYFGKLQPGATAPIVKEEEMDAKQFAEFKEQVESIGTAVAGLKGLPDQFKGVEERLKKIEEENKSLHTQIAATGDGADRREFAEYVGTKLATKINEAGRTAVVEHLMSLRKAEPLKFDDGKGGKTEKSAIDNYKEQLQALPDVVAFGESATKDKAGDTTVNGMDAATLGKKAAEYQDSEAAAGRTVTMTDAVAHIKKGGK